MTIFVESKSPAPNQEHVTKNTDISFTMVDSDGYVDTSTILVYIQESLAYDGSIDTFYAPFSGSLSFFVGGSLDGYDAYQINLSRSSEFPGGTAVTVRAVFSDDYGDSIDEEWVFATRSSQIFLEQYDPLQSETNVAISTDVSVFLVDPDGYVLTETVDAYVDGSLVYDGYTDTVYPPFASGGLTLVPGGSLDGYDAYRLLLVRSSDFDYGDTIPVRVVVGGEDYPAWDSFYWGSFLWDAIDSYKSLDESWSFSTIVFDSTAPLILNRFPTPGSLGVSSSTLVYFDAVDATSIIDLSNLNVTIGGQSAVSAGVFVPPFNGTLSDITPTTVGVYDGYHVVIDSDVIYSGLVPVSATAVDSYGNSTTSVWSFQVGSGNNIVYFSDGYGLKAIDVGALAGESQYAVRPVLNSGTTPSINDDVKFIHGTTIDSYGYLALSYDVTPGVVIIKQESEINPYLISSAGLKAHITTQGTLYVVNKSSNEVEVYYGATTRTGSRSPDYVYSTTSTPPLFAGMILDLHVVSGASAVLSGGTRFYVATDQGATRVDTYDAELDGYDGYGAGLDGYGISFTYGIVGSGADYEVIGGTVARCTEISSDDDRLVMMVATDDNNDNGGMTQISLSGNRKILFINKATGLIPSNTINDIFGKSF